VTVAIVTDTCHYLPAGLVADAGLRQVSLYVHWPQGAQRESEIADYDAFWRRLRSEPSTPSTSQPAIGDFTAAYQALLGEGHEVVSVHVAAGISGTVHAAEQARAQLGERAARIEIVDSRSACCGEGLVVLAAAAAARAGADAAAVADRARRARLEVRTWFTVDNLEHLRRSGRIGGAQAWLGSALRIRPILTLDSQIAPVERVRSGARAFERLLQLLGERAARGGDAWIVQHIRSTQAAEELAARGTELVGRPPVVVSEIGPVIGAHVGSGLLGVGSLPSSFLD